MTEEIKDTIIKASSINIGTSETGKDKVIEKDPFSSDYGGATGILEPIEDPIALSAFPNISSNLPQCIDAMATNVGGLGFNLERTIDENHPRYKEYEKQIEEEHDKLRSWFEWLDLMTPDSWNSLCRNTRKEEETIGTAFWQEVPNSLNAVNNGRSPILEITKMPAKYVRFTRRDKEAIETTMEIPFDYEYQEVTVRRRFRRIVEYIDLKKIYFKEYFDPRSISSETGLETPLPLSDQANKVVVFKIYNAESEPYGLPRWYGNTVAIGYAREAENVLYMYFSDNAIPPLAILVSGGRMAEGAIEKIEEHIKAHKGKKSQFSALFLEAEPASLGENTRNVKVELKPLAGSQFDVNKFREIDKDTQRKTLGIFRLPNIVVGLSQDYNRATAEAALLMAEQQVFGPERDEFDHIINTTIMSTFKARFHKYASSKPELSEPKDLNNLVRTLTESLAITPTEARKIVNRFLRIDLAPYEKEDLEGTGGGVPAKILLEKLKISSEKTATPEDQTINKAMSDGNMAEKFVEMLIGIRHNLGQRVGADENLAEKFEKESSAE